MGVRIAWTIVALIIIGAAISAMFRIANAPDRIKARHDTAKEVCIKSGGEWVINGRDAIRDAVCKRA